MGQFRADGVLLPGRRPGGPPRVRHGRAAHPPPAGVAAGGRARRNDRADRDLPHPQRRPGIGGRLGTAMSTDTAFALGLLALVGAHAPDRVSTYLLTFSIVDDVAGIVVIALAFSRHVAVPAVAIGLAFLALVIAARARGIRSGPLYLLLGLA